ncbi:phosphopantetheine-binding protein (plasmid) [Streptomyces cynarae]|uniref:Phosphopantetheine-binding protein n=1 Tax=Streptomyces cynarae TaxID=2981134 RepID=A0ABY6EGI9_9ACTN|nr:phosphopantetheine-binding protein [Streptomyces cynarae]UXY24911.1 phosphopantetheine-binding protein [Streptomyces cynarae]
MEKTAEGDEDSIRLAPRTRHEEVLFGIWRDVLGTDDLGVEDDFFVLGGNSLHVIRIISRLGEFTGAELPLQFVHDHPTIAEAAARLDTLTAEGCGAVAPSALTGDASRWNGDW